MSFERLHEIHLMEMFVGGDASTIDIRPFPGLPLLSQSEMLPTPLVGPLDVLIMLGSSLS